MADPKLTRTSVVIKYRSDDGYSVAFNAAGGDGTLCPEPNKAMADALGELARIMALFGHEAEARAAFDRAVEDVAEWRKERQASPRCKSQGVIAPGGVCNMFRVGGGCGFDGPCKHKEGGA